jgi:hypothetical protein
MSSIHRSATPLVDAEYEVGTVVRKRSGPACLYQLLVAHTEAGKDFQMTSCRTALP